MPLYIRDDEVKELGGLYVLGTERHESRRIDNQLRGRSGRQGDPDTSVIFASVEDPIVERHLPLKRPPGGADPETGEFPRGKAADMLDSAQRVAEGAVQDSVIATYMHGPALARNPQLADLLLARALGVEPGGTVDPADARRAVLGLRRGKGMVLDPADHDTWSVGSFFTNPVVPAAVAAATVLRIEEATGESTPQYPAPDGVKLSAGWLIERAGFRKGYDGGRTGVSLSTKHTLALTNRGTGTTAELLDLAGEVRVQHGRGARLQRLAALRCPSSA